MSISSLTPLRGGIEISTPAQKKTKNLNISDIPSELYWKISEIKTKYRLESWAAFFKFIVTAEIVPKGEYEPSFPIEEKECIQVPGLSEEFYWELTSLKDKLRCKTWLSLLKVIVNAEIVPSIEEGW